jgi:condensin complex subunit 1
VTDQDDEALALALESNGISSEDNNNQSEEQQQNQDEQPQDQSSQEQQVQNSEDNNEQQQEQQQQRKKKVISPDQYAALKKMRTYHKDAITFIKLVHGSIPVICQLLSSKSKAEVLESMDYLVNTYNYKIDLALVSKAE